MNMVKDLSIEIVDMDMEEANRKLNSGKTITFTDKKKRKDGSVYWTEVVVTPLKYENRQANLSINRDITERKQAEKRKDHLNSVLKSIRNVNQLLVKEDERDKLIEGICDILVDTRDYHNVWIALFDESGELVTTAESGLGNDFEPMRDLLDNRELPDRVRKTLENEGAIVTDNPPVNCNGCPLSGNYEGRSSITVRIEYGGRVFGMISASVPEKFAYEKGERQLFEEVAGDIAFGLHDIEVEKRRREANEKLRKSEEQFKRAIQYAPFPMMIHAEDGQVIEVNDAWVEITGYEREDISTISDWTEKAYGEARNNVKEHIEKMFELEERLDEGELEIQTKEGSTRVWDFSSTPLGKAIAGERRLALSMANDVTARKKVMSELTGKEEEMSILFNNLPGMAYRCENDREWTMKFVSQGAKELTGYPPEEIIENALVSYGELIVPEDKERVWNEVQRALDSDQPYELEYRIETKEGQEKHVWARGRGVYTDKGELKNLQGFISDITERKKVQNELRQSFIELAETTSRVLGVRDPYTQAHELRVGELAREVGRRMGLEKEELLGLYLGGVLHDIGKIAIPETILTKPGELKDVEWKMIKSHPKVGYNQILKDTDFPWAVAEMTLHHHERLDGSGYPDGLTGEELSKEVRILAAVDVVEAMSTRRPYREARSKETTLDVIQDGKGDKFDPEVVEVLVEMIDEGEIEFGE